MSLTELSKQYRINGQLCRKRVAELKRTVQVDELSHAQRLELQRRITILSAMSRDAIEISNYLAKYYDRGGRIK